MYLDFLLLIFDYFKTLTKRIIIYEWGFPFLISLILFVIFEFNGTPKIIKNFNGNTIRLLSVLIGFSITIIIILTTGNSKNLNQIKRIETNFKIKKKNLSLYELLITNFTYSVIIEIILIFASLILPLIFDVIKFSPLTIHIFFSFNIFLILHILLINMRNLTDFCFILMKK